MRHQPAGRVVFEASTEGGRIAVLEMPDGYRAVRSEGYPTGGDWVRPAETFAQAMAHFEPYEWHQFNPVTVDAAVQAHLRSVWTERVAAQAPSRVDKRWQSLLNGD